VMFWALRQGASDTFVPPGLFSLEVHPCLLRGSNPPWDDRRPGKSWSVCSLAREFVGQHSWTNARTDLPARESCGSGRRVWGSWGGNCHPPLKAQWHSHIHLLFILPAGLEPAIFGLEGRRLIH
jgi:hypothetical protein